MEELDQCLQGKDEDNSFLFLVLIQALIQGFLKDIKGLQEKEIYSSPAILILELLDDIPRYPLEGISLIFNIKRYKKCVKPSILEFLKECSDKCCNSENTIYTLSYKEKKELLITLTKGLYISPKLREVTAKYTQDQKDQRHLEKRRATLQKEVDIFESVQNGPRPVEITAEKKKEMSGINKEILKISNEIKKRANKQTIVLGHDAEGKEYWIFAGDKRRLYIRDQLDKEENWGTYSTNTHVLWRCRMSKEGLNRTFITVKLRLS